MAALLPGNDAVDLNFNWYGSLFKSSVLANAFRRGPQNYDFGAGYSHELYNGGPDLRLNVTGYRFSAGSGVYGVKGGAELKTRDGMFVVKYEVDQDRITKTYHTIGGFVNVGLQLENLLSGQSPFIMPEPIFRSPRNLRKMLTRSMASTRNTSQPASVVRTRTEGNDDNPPAPGMTQVSPTWTITPGLLASPGNTGCNNFNPDFNLQDGDVIRVSIDSNAPANFFNVRLYDVACLGAAIGEIQIPGGARTAELIMVAGSFGAFYGSNATGVGFDPGTIRVSVWRW